MAFWSTWFGGANALKDDTAEAMFIYSQCAKCGEKFRNRIDKQHDLQTNYEDAGPAYRSHKELVGSRCRNLVVIDLEFDERKRLIGKEIQQGRFLSREEFEETPLVSPPS